MPETGDEVDLSHVDAQLQSVAHLTYESPADRVDMNQHGVPLMAFLLGICFCIPFFAGAMAIVLAVGLFFDWKNCNGAHRVLTLLAFFFGAANILFWLSVASRGHL